MTETSMKSIYITINIDIFAPLNFRAPGLSRHFSHSKMFTHILVNSICCIMIQFFTHIKFSRSYIRPCAKICTAPKFLLLQYVLFSLGRETNGIPFTI